MSESVGNPGGNRDDEPGISAAEERAATALAHYERHKCERTRREFVRALLNAATVAAAKEMDRGRG